MRKGLFFEMQTLELLRGKSLDEIEIILDEGAISFLLGDEDDHGILRDMQSGDKRFGAISCMSMMMVENKNLLETFVWIVENFHNFQNRQGISDKMKEGCLQIVHLMNEGLFWIDNFVFTRTKLRRDDVDSLLGYCFRDAYFINLLAFRNGLKRAIREDEQLTTQMKVALVYLKQAFDESVNLIRGK